MFFLACILILVAVVIAINAYTRHRDERQFRNRLQAMIDEPDGAESTTLSPESNTPERNTIVEINDNEVRVSNSGEETQVIRWDDLQRVFIQTTDEGPFAPDVFWILQGSEERCVVPQGAMGEPELMERLQRLPGFKSESIIDAMGCVTNQIFECWWAENS